MDHQGIPPKTEFLIVFHYSNWNLNNPMWSEHMGWFKFMVASGKESACQSRQGFKRPRFVPWVGKIPLRRAWQPTPVFLPGESHGQRSLAGYSPWGRSQSQTRLRWLSTAQHVASTGGRPWGEREETGVPPSLPKLIPTCGIKHGLYSLFTFVQAGNLLLGVLA